MNGQLAHVNEFGGNARNNNFGETARRPRRNDFGGYGYGNGQRARGNAADVKYAWPLPAIN